MDELKYLEFMQDHNAEISEVMQSVSESIFSLMINKGETETVSHAAAKLKVTAKKAVFEAPEDYKAAHELYIESMDNLYQAAAHTINYIKIVSPRKLGEQFQFYIKKYNNLMTQAQGMIIKIIEGKSKLQS